VKSPQRNEKPVSTGSGTLAITLHGIERFNHAGQIVQGFMNEALANGFHAMAHPPNATGVDEFEYLLNVRRGGIDGWALSLLSSTEKNVSLLRSFQRSGCALVLVDRYIRELESDFVITKNEEMAYTLTQELIRRGHREIGIISFPMDNTQYQDRFAGYRRAMAETGIPYEDDLLVMDRIQGFEPLRMQMLGLLGRRKRPTAVFCMSEHHAAWLVRELQRLDYKIPEDIELAVVDDNRFSEHTEFPVLSATQRSYEMGQRAAEFLRKRLAAPRSEWQHCYMDFDLNFSPTP
jgi:LacI family transcriptional regulator